MRVSFYECAIETWCKVTWVWKVYCGSQVSDHTPSLMDVTAGTQGIVLQTGISVEAMEFCCFMTVPCDLLCPHSTTCWMVALPTMSCTLIRQSEIKEIYTLFQRHFINYVSLFPNDSSLCQMDIRLSCIVCEQTLFWFAFQLFNTKKRMLPEARL